MDFKGENNNIKIGEKKRVFFEELNIEGEVRGEDRNREIVEVKKELKEFREYILQKVRDIKKERKRYQEVEEE